MHFTAFHGKHLPITIVICQTIAFLLLTPATEMPLNTPATLALKWRDTGGSKGHVAVLCEEEAGAPGVKPHTQQQGHANSTK